MKAIQKSLLALALAGAFTTANATPVDWTFTNTFIDETVNGVAETRAVTIGSFTYDADTNTFSNVYLVSPFYGSMYYSLTQLDANSYNLWQSSLASSYILDFTVDNPFTNAGGNLNFTGYYDYNNASSSYFIRGTLVGVPKATATAVPEPEAYAMMLAGLGLVGFVARRKLS